MRKRSRRQLTLVEALSCEVPLDSGAAAGVSVSDVLTYTERCTGASGRKVTHAQGTDLRARRRNQ